MYLFGFEYAVFLFLLSTFSALMEIQIEGKYGWAEKLPCWRPKEDSWVNRMYKKVLGNPKKALTGYHIAFNGLLLLILHSPFFAGVAWTIGKELQTISSFCLVAILEDFLWFCWNPSYGIKRFNPQNKDIWWVPDWVGPIPKDYIQGLVASALFAAPTVLFRCPRVFAKWGLTLGVLGVLTLFSVVLAELCKLYFSCRRKNQKSPQE